MQKSKMDTTKATGSHNLSKLRVYGHALCNNTRKKNRNRLSLAAKFPNGLAHLTKALVKMAILKKRCQNWKLSCLLKK